MNVNNGVILAGLGLLIIVLSFYFLNAADDVVTPRDVMWGLGRFFRDIDKEDVMLLEMVGLAGMALGGVLFLGGLILMRRRR